MLPREGPTEGKTALNVLFYTDSLRASARLVVWCALPEAATMA
ncbi:UNVERIFIED_ORG: hypothetical protein QOE_2526 [Clostridioides difficile F501]